MPATPSKSWASASVRASVLARRMACLFSWAPAGAVAVGYWNWRAASGAAAARTKSRAMRRDMPRILPAASGGGTPRQRGGRAEARVAGPGGWWYGETAMASASASDTPPLFVQHHPARQRGLNRRQMVQRMLAGAGAGMAMPMLAAAHPIHRHLADPETWAQADAQTAAGEWQPLFLDPHQNETFIVLAERIVPGSSRANVNRFVDLLLSVESQEAQRRFVNAVSAFDAAALAPTRPAPTPAWAERIEHLEEKKPEATNLRDHFETLKGWARGAYYSSEIGLKELGWNGQVMWPSYPGCQHPGHHA